MYEDLIKELRYLEKIYSICGNTSTKEYKLAVEAADVIEELSYKYEKALSDLVKGSKSNWIPATKRLPKIGELVVVYTHNDAVTNRMVWLDRMIVSSTNQTPYWDKLEGRILYWMPLPEPPKEEA